MIKKKKKVLFGFGTAVFFLVLISFFTNKFGLLIGRIGLFIGTLAVFIGIKLYYYFALLPIFEENLKEFFKKNYKVNKVSLFILKGTNLIYIYNDILFLIAKLMSKLRYFMYKYNYFETKAWQGIDIHVYIFFFILLKNFVEILVITLKKSKKKFIEKKINIFVRSRLIVWLILTFFFLIFGYFYFFKGIIFLFMYYILLESIAYSIEELDEFDFKIGITRSRRLLDERFISKYEKRFVYDELIETDYIFKNCVFYEDKNLLKRNIVASKQQVDVLENKDLSMQTENIYRDQPELYFKEHGKELYFFLISKILKLLKMNILYIMRIEHELGLDVDNVWGTREIPKELLEKKKKEYENLVLELKYFLSIIKNLELDYKILIANFEIEYKGVYYFNTIKVDLLFQLDKINVFLYDNKIEAEKLNKFYIYYINKLKEINSEESEGKYNPSSRILVSYYPNDGSLEDKDTPSEIGFIICPGFTLFDLTDIDFYEKKFNSVLKNDIGFFCENGRYLSDDGPPKKIERSEDEELLIKKYIDNLSKKKIERLEDEELLIKKFIDNFHINKYLGNYIHLFMFQKFWYCFYFMFIVKPGIIFGFGLSVGKISKLLLGLNLILDSVIIINISIYILIGLLEIIVFIGTIKKCVPGKEYKNIKYIYNLTIGKYGYMPIILLIIIICFWIIIKL